MHNNCGSIIDQSAPDINKLEVPYQLAFSASATIDNPPQGQTKYVYAKCVFLGDRQGIIQYESEPVMNRLSATRNQLTDINVAWPGNIRDLKSSQVMASNGLVFYESVVSDDWDFNQMVDAVGGQQQVSGTVCYYGDSKKDKTFLLADLIIDKVLINSVANTYWYHTNIKRVSHVRRCHVCDRVAPTSVGRWNVR